MNAPQNITPEPPRKRLPVWVRIILWLGVIILVAPFLIFGTCVLLFRMH